MAELFHSPAELYVLTDVVDFSTTGKTVAAARLIMLVQELVKAQVGLIQLRDKQRTDRELILAGQLIAGLTENSSTKFIMNDRADLAVAMGADGVHLGQEDMSIAAARKIFAAERARNPKSRTCLIGVSTHSIEQARAAVADGADYIGVGPVFPSQTKSFKSQVGLELVRAVAAEITTPAFAIGGIDASNVDEIVAAGLRRVAVIGAVSRSDRPDEVVQKLIERLSIESGTVEKSE